MLCECWTWSIFASLELQEIVLDLLFCLSLLLLHVLIQEVLEVLRLAHVPFELIVDAVLGHILRFQLGSPILPDLVINYISWDGIPADLLHCVLEKGRPLRLL